MTEDHFSLFGEDITSFRLCSQSSCTAEMGITGLPWFSSLWPWDGYQEESANHGRPALAAGTDLALFVLLGLKHCHGQCNQWSPP